MEKQIFQKHFLLLAALFLLLGCTEEISWQERMLCIELSSRSYAVVPACSSQEECFSLVEKKLFDFDDSLFSFQSRQELLSLKNNAAASWLFFNKALSNIKNINEMCYSGETLGIVEETNFLNHNLLQSFHFADKAFRKAFAFITLEKQFLEEQDIGIVKEEKLFDDYILVNANLNDLTSNNLLGKTAAADYLKESWRFLSLSNSTGFSSTVASKITLLDLFDKHSPLFAKNFAGKTFFFPLVSEAFSSFVSGISNIIRIQGAISILGTQPSFEFFEAYSGLMSEKNSALSQISSLLEGISVHKQEIFSSNENRTNRIGEKIEAIRKVSLELPEFSGKESDFISSLHLGTGTTIIAEGQLPAISQSSKKELIKDLSSIEQRLQEIKRADFLGNISLGKKTSSLKQLLADAQALEERSFFLQTELLDSILALCDERIKQINESVSLFPGDSVVASILKKKVGFRAKKYFDTTDKKEKLSACESTTAEFSESEKAMLSEGAFFESRAETLKQCISFFEGFFGQAEAKESYQDFFGQFEAIKKFSSGTENPDSLASLCSQLKQSLLSELSEREDIIRLNELFTEAERLMGFVEEYQNIQGLLDTKTIQNIESEFLEIKKFFVNKNFFAEKYFGSREKVSEHLGSFNSKTVLLVEKAIIGFAEKNSSKEIILPETVFAGKKNKTIHRLVMENPFSYPLKKHVSLSIPFSGELRKIVFASQNFLNAENSGENLIVQLSSFPSGKTVLELETEFFPETKEKTLIEYVSEQKIIVSKRIWVNFDTVIPRLQLETVLDPSNLAKTDIAAFFGKRETEFFAEEGSVRVLVQNALPEKEILLFYSVLNPFEKSLSLQKASDAGKGTETYSYLLEVKNKTSFELESVSVSLPVEQQNNLVEFVEVFDEAGKTKKAFVPEAGSIQVTIGELLPLQSKKLFVNVKTKNSPSFWQKNLLAALAKASSLSASSNDSIAKQAGKIKQLLTGFEETFYNSGSRIEDFLELLKKLEELEKESNSLEAQKDIFLQEKNRVLLLLQSLQEKAETAKSIGLQDQHKKILAKASKARIFLSAAEAMFSRGDIGSAILELEKAKKTIIEIPIFSDFSLFLASLEEMKKEADSLSGFSELLDEAGKSLFFALQDNLLSAETEIVSSISFEDFPTAKQKLQELQKQFSEAKENVFAQLEKQATNKQELIDEMKKKKQGISELAALLKKQISQAKEGELIKAKYVLPTSIERIQKLEEKSQNVPSKSVENAIEKFSQSFKEKDFGKALLSIKPLDKKLLDEIEQAENANSELETAWGKIKEDAVSMHNAAVTAFNLDQANREAQEYIAESEELIKKQRFLESIVFSSKALSMQKTNFTGFAVLYPAAYFVPIIAAIALIYWIRKYKEKREQKRKEEREKVLESWE